MDKQTKELYDAWKERNKEEHGIPWPKVQIDMYDEHPWSFVRKSHSKHGGYHAIYRAYTEQAGGYSEYAEAYKILAFTIFGYGNWSNNDRRRQGLPAIRSDWYGKVFS